jgi:hypothetical protein
VTMQQRTVHTTPDVTEEWERSVAGNEDIHMTDEEREAVIGDARCTLCGRPLVPGCCPTVFAADADR